MHNENYIGWLSVVRGEGYLLRVDQRIDHTPKQLVPLWRDPADTQGSQTRKDALEAPAMQCLPPQVPSRANAQGQA